MSDLHPALAAFSAQRSSAFTALVGIEFTAVERGQCTLRLAIEDMASSFSTAITLRSPKGMHQHMRVL